ncbi:uncharacterized protein LOC115222572 [Argonauta hians]
MSKVAFNSNGKVAGPKPEKKVEFKQPLSTNSSNDDRETITIVYENCSKGIGLQIIGGTSRDGNFNYGIFVKKLLPNGIAKTEGQLKVGDQLLSVNGNSLEEATNEYAVDILRRASESNHMELVITRDEQASFEFLEVFDFNPAHSTSPPSNLNLYHKFVPNSPDYNSKYSSRTPSPGSTPMTENSRSVSPQANSSKNSPRTPTSAQTPSFPAVQRSPSPQSAAPVGVPLKATSPLVSSTKVSPQNATQKVFFQPTVNKSASPPPVILLSNSQQPSSTTNITALVVSPEVDSQPIKSEPNPPQSILVKGNPQPNGQVHVAVKEFPVSETTAVSPEATTSPQSSLDTPPSPTVPLPRPYSPSDIVGNDIFPVLLQGNNNTQVTSPGITSPGVTPSPENLSDNPKWTTSDYDFPDAYKQAHKYDKPFTYGITSPTEISLARSRIPMNSPTLPKYNGWRETNANQEISQEIQSYLKDNEAHGKSSILHIQEAPSNKYGNSNSVNFYQDENVSTSNQLTPPTPIPLTPLTPPTPLPPPSPQNDFNLKEITDLWQTLGFQPTPPELTAIKNRVSVDEQGMISYEEILKAASEVCQPNTKSSEKDFSPSPNQEIGTDTVSQEVQVLPDSTMLSLEEVAQIQLEKDILQIEVEKLRAKIREKEDSCNNAEEELLRIRREAQGAIHETRSLRSKVHLAEEAQKAARSLEQGYEEAIQVLEKEIVQLRAQVQKQSKNSPVHRQLAVAACQLRKMESCKKTYEVAIEKLLKFTEHVQEVLEGSSIVKLAGHQESSKSSSIKLKNKFNPVKNLATEAKDLSRSVKLLIDSQPLPYGWEEAYSSDGLKYYLNHINQITTWSHPLSGTQQFPSTGNYAQVAPTGNTNNSSNSSSSNNNNNSSSASRTKALPMPGPSILKETKN